MSHPPFAHNPHVYNGIDPDGNPTTSMVVTSRAADVARVTVDGVEVDGTVVNTDTAPGPAVNAETGEVTPSGGQLPEADAVQPDEDAPVDVDGDGQITEYEVFTKVDLVKHIETLNETRADDDQLSTAGNKPDLVRRIQEAEAAAAQPARESGGD